MSERIEIVGVPFDNITWDECLAKFDELIAKRTPVYVITPNVDHIVKLHKNPSYRKVYDEAALNLADGVPVMWAAKFLGTPLKDKISGSDLLPVICKVAAEKGYRLFFMGGREGAAVKAAAEFCKRFPGLQIAGTYCPPFGFEKDDAENTRIVNMIRDSKADILFVGLGAPKQEDWVLRFRDQYQVPISIGVGASFDFAAGMVKRAPVWMQKAGLEWFWRIMMEPRRLWRRYIIEDMQFFPLLLKQKFARR